MLCGIECFSVVLCRVECFSVVLCKIEYFSVVLYNVVYIKCFKKYGIVYCKKTSSGNI